MSLSPRFKNARIRHRKPKATGTTPRRRKLWLEALEDRRLLAAEPTVTLDVPADPFIGTSPLVIQATFDNTSSTSTDVGYGPFIDIVFPVNGADGAAGTDTPDGIWPLPVAPAAPTVTYLNQPVTAFQYVFPDDGSGTGCVAHPYAVDNTNTPLQVCGTAGDVLVVVQLPFGSFAPDQPPATVELEASLSNWADLGVGLPYTARGGFQYGSDPLNNPSVDPSILTTDSEGPESGDWDETATTTPTVMTMTKTYFGPENETATGPNFPRQYVLTVSVAPGQTVTDLDIVDGFDNNIVVTGISATPAPSFVAATPFGPANFAFFPSQALVATIPTVTGTGGDDVRIVIDFYVPEFDANGERIIPLEGEDDTTASPDSRTLNDARAQGDWTPLDTRDADGVNVNNAVAEPDFVNPDHILDDKSLAIQKSVSVVGGGDAAPGVYLEYTLEFQVSDYYTFADFVITDVISDGQDFLDALGNPVLTPTFSVSDRSGTTPGTFAISFPPAPATDTLSHTINANGTETLVFDVSRAMQAFGDDGILIGGLATAADDFNIPPENVGLEPRAVGSIVFRVRIPDEYAVPPGVDFDGIAQGDSLGNTATIAGDVLDNDSLEPLDPSVTEDDDTSAGIGLPIGEVSKSIYAVNGVYPPPTGFVLAPGDQLTYSIEYTLPFTSFVDFSLHDFLPLPVFNVMDPKGTGVPGWSFNVEADSADRENPPLPGVVELGPNDTLYDYTGPSAVPAYYSPPDIDTDVASNSLSFSYGSYNSGSNIENTVHLLFTITASDRPFADGLFLTNIVRATESDSMLDASVDDAIIQFQLGQPALNITKGVVATDQLAPPAEFVPTPVGPAGVTFHSPGSSPSFSGTVTSAGLTANPIDSNLQNVDAGDLVTFAIVVENTGSSRKGAYAVQVLDTLPTGFRIPTAGESAAQLNLQVRDGTGTLITWNPVDTGDTNPLFEDGIELADPGPTAAQADGTDGGALDQYNATSGRNILIVTYDLIAETSVQPRETIVNTATLTSYAGAEGGQNHVAPTDQPYDEAEVTIAPPTIDKTIVTTNQDHTDNLDVAIGEIVTYQVVITVPEGTSSGVTLKDTLDEGLAFVDVLSVIPSAGVSYAAPVINFPTYPVASTDPVDKGRQLTMNFGTVTNADTNNSVPETITVTYRAVVLNSTANVRGVQLNNDAVWTWSGGSVSDAAPEVVIVEPAMRVIKDASPLTGAAGDRITFNLEVQQRLNSNADAFNVALTDAIPAVMTYVPGTLQWTGGIVPTSLSESSGTITVIWDTFDYDPNIQRSSFLTFDVTLNTAVTPGQVIRNKAKVTYTSLPDDVSDPQSDHNDLSVERPGSYEDPADVTIIDPAVLDKTIVATSESHTGGSDVAIGEIVRYRLRAKMIQGTMPNVQFVDWLPTGLSFLDAGPVHVSFVSDRDVTSTDSDWDLGGANGGAIPPTFMMPASRVVVDGQLITFNFGTLVNNDTDSDDEIVVLEFNALVVNTSDTNDQNVKSNVFDVRVGGDLIATSQPVDVTILEPEIVNLNKQIVGTPPPYDAGDQVTYQVTYTNTGTTDAFDVRVVDALDADYLTLALPPTVTLAGGAGLIVENSAGNTIDVTIGRVPKNGSVTIVYTATLTTAVEPGQVVPNTANLTYTSLPGGGTPVGLENTTGSVTPGGSGADNGERDGSGGVNDYRGTDSESLTIQSPALSKSLIATDQVHTKQPPEQESWDVAIGEIVTYEVTVIVPEGTSDGVQIVDTLAQGLAFVDVVSIVASDGLSFADPDSSFAIFPAGSTDPGDVDRQLTLNFGTVTNTNTDNGVAETITIVYRAVVLNTVANALNVQLDNTAVLTWSQGTLTDRADPVTIVEPDLSVSKSPGNPPLGDAGDTITFTIQVAHTGISSADAFNVQLVDLIDPELNKMTYVPASVLVVNDGGATLAPGSPDDASGDLYITWSDFPWGATSTITFDVVLDVSVVSDEILTNTANLTWTSLPGDVTAQQSSNPYSVERTGDPDGPGESGANTYARSDSGVVFTPGSPLLKAIERTSEGSTGSGQHNPAITDLTIGETVTFVLIPSLIDGTYNNVVITDQLPFAPGVLEYVDARLAFAGADLTDGSGDPIVELPPPVLSDMNGDGVAELVFNFGTIVNLADSRPLPDSQDEMIIELTARVLDIPANRDGLELVNTATFYAGGSIRGEDQVSVEIVEPLLTIAKDAAPAEVDGGDTVTFTITVNHTDESTADAFDVSITDVLPDGLTYAGNIVTISGVTPTVSLESQQVTFSWISIPWGAVPDTFTFDVTVDPTITPWTTFDNLAELEWSSLPGYYPEEERTEYWSDPAETITSSTTARNPVKTVAATSEPATDGTDVAVGEIVRYRLQVELTEGTFPNLQLVDTLPAGLILLDKNQVRVSFTSDVPMGLAGDLSEASNSEVPPTFVLPDSRIGVSGQQVTFNLGDVVNNDDDANSEFVTLEFNALVSNTAAVNNGETKSNTFEVFVQATSFGASPPVTVTVREPSITDVTKTVTSSAPVDAGDHVTYQVSYSNTGPEATATATAFDVRLRDVLDPALFSSVFISSIALDDGASGITNDTAGTTLDLTIATVPVGGSVVVTYTGILSVNVQPGQTIPNTANVTYTSLPGAGTPLGPDNLTGSITPGGSGADDGERDGSDGVDEWNDYADSDNADVTLTGQPLFEKSLSSSSEPHTADPELTIGEQATYTLVLTIPEGTLPGVSIADAMPPGLELVAFDSITASSAAVTTDVAGGFAKILTDANAGLAGNKTSFSLNFGTLTNSDTDDLVTETLTIVYRAVVLNESANVNGQTRTNDASFTWSGGTIDDTVTIEIVEPDLVVTKAANPTSGDGGDTITLTISIDHTANSAADAFDVAISDLLPAGMAYAGNLQVTTTPVPTVTESGQQLTFSWDVFPLSGPRPYTFTFDVVLDATVAYGQTLTNTAEATWTSLEGDAPGNGERTGADGPGGLNDYASQDPADVLITTTARPLDPAKSIVATSEAHTTGTNVAIGEIVRYRLQVEVLEGTVRNLQLVDTLPAGMQLVDAGRVTVSFLSDVNMTVAEDLAGANNDAIPPTFVLPASRVSQAGQVVTFSLGDVQNNDSDNGNVELVTIEYNALVLNTAQNNQGDSLTNSFVITAQNAVTGNQDQLAGPFTTTVNVVEPRIDNVTKAAIAFVGDVVTYQVTYSNTGTATAFDVQLTDALPAGLVLNPASIAVTLAGGATGANTSGSANKVAVLVSTMPMGGSVTVTYNATAANNGQSTLNTARVTYTSLSGPNGTLVNPTGSPTPGGSGTDTGQRDGSDGEGGAVDDYADSDSESVALVSGQKRDTSGTPLAGVTIYLDVIPNAAFDLGEPYDVTDASGNYVLAYLSGGVHTLRELVPDLYLPTSPPGGAQLVDFTTQTTVTGVDFVNGRVAPVILDDGVPGFSFVGDWVVSQCEYFYQSDAHYICGTIGGTNVARWQFAGLEAGATYQVSATWVGGTGRSTDAPYTVTGGSVPVTTVMNQRLSPSAYPGSFQDQGASWANLTTAYTVFGDTLTVQLSDAHSGGCVIADAIRVIRVTTPEISVWDGGASQVDGVSQVNLGETVLNTPLPRQFLIRNEGGATLSLGMITLPPGYSLVQGLGSATLLPGQSTTFRVQLDAAALGTFPGWITVGNNDNDEAPFSFGITGRVGSRDAPTTPPPGSPPAPPPAAAPSSIILLEGADVLYPAISTVDYGTTSVPQGVTRTFTILNPATATSNVTLGSLVVPTGFSAEYAGAGVDLEPGDSLTFQVTLAAASAGTFAGDVTLSGTGGELPFVFTVTGDVVAGLPPLTAPVYIDNGDAGYSDTAGFYRKTGTGYLGDYEMATGDSTGDYARWTFTNLPIGTFRVSASWFGKSSFTASAPYRLSGIDGGPQTFNINQRVPANDFVDQGVAWENLGTFPISGGTLVVELTDSTTGYLTADAIRVEQLTRPEITVLDGGTELTSGSSVVNFGDTLLGTPVSRTLTVRNVGGGPLQLPASLAVPGGFSLTAPFGSTSLASGQSTTLTIRLNAEAAGTFSGPVSFLNNDADESPFQFTIQGLVGLGAPALGEPVYIDNGDAGYSFTAGFYAKNGTGYLGDYLMGKGDNTGDYAQWQFTGLPGGTFTVATSYFNKSSWTNAAQYTVSWVDQAGVPQNQPFPVDQRVAARDLYDRGIWWKQFGIETGFVFEVQSGSTLTVRLSDQGTGSYIVGDAVRIERSEPLLAEAPASGATGADRMSLDAVPKALVQQAAALWAAADPAAAARLAGVQVFVADLPGQTLGLASAWTDTIWLDADAAGQGWAVSGERSSVVSRQWSVVSGLSNGAASSFIPHPSSFDLLTVIAHELGHVLGLGHAEDEHGLMAETLSAGVRRLTLPQLDRRGGLFTPDFLSSRAALGTDNGLARALALGDWRSFSDWAVAEARGAFAGREAGWGRGGEAHEDAADAVLLAWADDDEEDHARRLVGLRRDEDDKHFRRVDSAFEAFDDGTLLSGWQTEDRPRDAARRDGVVRE